MASIGLPPPPINDAPGSFTWLEWYRQLRSYISTSGSVPWYVINFAGSNINDIQDRDHNELQNLQGGKVNERYHLTAAQAAALTAGDHNTLDGLQGGTINERYHIDENTYNELVTTGYLPLTGGTLTGPLNIQGAQGELGTIQMVPDVGTPGSDVMEIKSDDGIILRAPYIVIDTSNPILTMPGPQIGASVIVAGIDPFGGALLGYQAPVPPDYMVQATTTTPVLIKAAGVAPPSPWVELGLNVLITENLSAGDVTIMFDMLMSNPTNRSGVVEFGLRVNGVDNYRDITQDIPASFASTIALAIPLLAGFSTNDDVRLIARVTSNSNNGFELSMAASTSDVAVFRLYTGGSGAAESIPTGTLNSFAGSIPIGWLYANGTTVSRTTYADLFAVIGTTWGPGDGSTTFHLPNVQEYTYVGYDSTGAAKAILVGIKT